MDIRIECVCVDCADPAVLAEFWRQALGWRQTADADGDIYLQPPPDTPGAGPDLYFLRVPERKAVKNRLHLDLRPGDQAAEVARLEALGARRVDIGQGEASWVVMADPEGNEFCVLRSVKPEDLSPNAAAAPMAAAPAAAGTVRHR